MKKIKTKISKTELTLEDLEIELEGELEFGPNIDGPRRDIGGPNA